MRRAMLACALLFALCACCGAGNYYLTIQNGRICYQTPDGTWVDTGQSAACVPFSDRVLVAQGLYFPKRAALTRALEDFCS